MIRPLALVPFLGMGCMYASVDLGSGSDEDQDGLMSDEEAAVGSDPTNPDTDGDSFLDGEEVSGFTDPTDADDHPYAGGWPIDSCRNDVQSTGTNVGDVAEQIELMDQFGETVRLHDFCGKAVLMIFSAEWCGPCNEKAATLEDLYQGYKDDGFIALEIMSQQQDGSNADQATLERWADLYSLTMPVLADPDMVVAMTYLADTIPSETLLGHGSELIVIDGDGESAIPNAL